MEKVFVTGGDGLLGSNLVRSLLKRGHSVRVMVQPGRKPITLEGLAIERAEADLLDADAVKEVSRGCNQIIHVAALTNVWPSRGEIYHKINVQGTENMIAAALAHGVSRFVHVGSASTFLYGSKEKPGDESKVNFPSPYGLDYIDTKTLGSQRVQEAVLYNELPALITCPTFMMGGYDSKPSSGAMIIAIATRKTPGYSPGGKNWVCVTDVAEGICNALTQGRIGESYIMGHENLSYHEAFERIAAVAGVQSPSVPFPSALVQLGGLIGQTVGALRKKTPALTYPMARVSCHGHYFSPAKAVRELSLPQTPIEVGVQEALDWFREHKYL